LPSPDFSAEPFAASPQVIDQDEEEEGHDQTLISASTKDWGEMMGGIVAGAQVTVPRAISVSDVASLPIPIIHDVEEDETAAAGVTPDFAMAAEEPNIDLPMEAPMFEAPVIAPPAQKQASLDVGTYDVDKPSLKLPDLSFSMEANDLAGSEPESLPSSALIAIEEPQSRAKSLPTGEYSLEGSNVVAMPWLDGQLSTEEAAAASNNDSPELDLGGLDDLFEDPVEMSDVKAESPKDVDGDLAAFLED
jgi:hypothetical protein